MKTTRVIQSQITWSGRRWGRRTAYGPARSTPRSCEGDRSCPSSGGADHGYGPKAPCRVAAGATVAEASTPGARARSRPSGGTDGYGSDCRNSRHYMETARLFRREGHRRLFGTALHSPGKLSPGLFSDPAQTPENAGLLAGPFVLARDATASCAGTLASSRKRPDPFARGRMPDPQIRRNLTARESRRIRHWQFQGSRHAPPHPCHRICARL